MMIARSAAIFAGGVAVRPIEPVVGTTGPPPPPPPLSLPLAATQNGNLFTDRNNANLYWYLPDFELAADTDPSFAFTASQSGQQANGQPFNKAEVTFGLNKLQPAQVTQFGQANPNATFSEIPLENLAAVLSSFYTDQNGQQQARTFNASSVQDSGGGAFLVTFDGSILGDSVVALYQDLTVFGKAVIGLTACFEAWSQPAPPVFPGHFRAVMLAAAPQATVAEPAVAAAPQATVAELAVAAPPQAAVAEPAASRPVAMTSAPMAVASPQAMRRVDPAFIYRPVPTPAPTPAQPAPALVQVKLPFSETLPLNLKYNFAGYQLRYTVSTATVASHVILSASDLSSFNQSQTQFAELKSLGDINSKYPTISCAYFGVMSRTIVLIPQRYSIVRRKTGCLATCTARVDTSPSSSSQCAFEFSFIIAPEVSGIELRKLQQDIAGDPDFSGYQITFADFTSSNPPSSLPSTFLTSVQFAAGADPHTFAVTATVQDGGPSTPAVVNANIFIVQLSAQSGTDLLASLSLKLDDGFPNPVLATIDLNFSHTAGTGNELLAQFDETANLIQVTNQSILDLQLQDYALIQNSTLTEFPGLVSITAGGTASLPLPANHTGLQFVPVAQLLLPADMNAAAVSKYLTFQTVNVQDTQYVVAVDASQVDFTKIASLAVVVTFPALTSIQPWQFSLTANLKADSTHIQVPLENAVFSLPGTVNITANYVDTTVNPVVFTLQNDFTSVPVLSLLESQIDSQLPPKT